MMHALPDTTRGTSADAAARLSEVEALVNMLDANRFSAATVADFGLGQWHMAALVAQVQDPSLEAQAMVIRVLRRREAARAAAEPDFPGAAAGAASNGSGRVRMGRGAFAANHHSSSAFGGWVAVCRRRLERFVKYAGASDFGRKRTSHTRTKSSLRPLDFK